MRIPDPDSFRLSLPNTRLNPLGEEVEDSVFMICVCSRGGLVGTAGLGNCETGWGGGRANGSEFITMSSMGNPAMVRNAATSSRNSLFSSNNFCRSATTAL